MNRSAGEANITIIVIILIGIVAAVGTLLISKLADNTVYTSCCNEAGGIWKNGYCAAQTPTSCESREEVWKQYDSCALSNGKNHANEKYRAVECD